MGQDDGDSRRVIADWHIVEGGLVGQYRAVRCPGTPPSLILERAGMDALGETTWAPVGPAAEELVYTALALHLSALVEQYAIGAGGGHDPGGGELDDLEEALRGGPVGDA